MNKNTHSWLIFRAALLLAGLSLLAYVPYKYLTQLHAVTGFYAYLFPLSVILGVAGVLLAVKPALAVEWPLTVRSGVAALAAGWIATGILCIPSLLETTRSSLLPGLFATFHMTTQHLFLSFGVAFLFLAPRSVFGFFGVDLPLPKAATAAREGARS